MSHFVSYIKILKCNFLTEFSVEVNLLIDGKDSCLCGQVDIYALPAFCSGHLSMFMPKPISLAMSAMSILKWGSAHLQFL